LFEHLGINGSDSASRRPVVAAQRPYPEQFQRAGKGDAVWLRENPAQLGASANGDARLAETVKSAASRARLKWRETNYLLLRRGPYIIGAGLDESTGGDPTTFRGRFVNLFDSELQVRNTVALNPGSRVFLVDLNRIGARLPRVLASACKALPVKVEARKATWMVEGIANTPAIVLISSARRPSSVTLAGARVEDFEYSPDERLLRVRFVNQARSRELAVRY
jgi:hypothetical protein